MKIKCVIVEDEPFALRLVQEYVEKTEELDLLQAFSNPIEGLDFIQSHQVDLVLLDINMPDLNGMELSKVISDNTKIIFTTAYSEYAVESYKVKAVDYLLKPFNYEEFYQAVKKAVNHFDLLNNQKNEGDCIYVRADHKQYKVLLDKILFVENLKNYVIFRLEDSSKIMALMSLKSLEDSLPDNFSKVHRSFIVNVNFVDALETNHLMIRNNQIPISDSHKKEFKNRMMKRSIN